MNESEFEVVPTKSPKVVVPLPENEYEAGKKLILQKFKEGRLSKLQNETLDSLSDLLIALKDTKLTN